MRITIIVPGEAVMVIILLAMLALVITAATTALIFGPRDKQ